MSIRFTLAAVLPAAFAALFAVHSPCEAQTVYIRSDLTLRVDGERFFPIGLVELGNDRYPDWNDRIRSSGANIVWDNGMAYVDSLPDCAAIRDSAQAAGYRLLVGSPDTWDWDDPNTPELEVAKPMYDPDSLAAVLNTLSPARNLIGFANRDEPEWTISQGWVGDIDSLHVFDTYHQLRSASPYRIVAMNFAPVHVSGDLATWEADIGGYLGATDVVMFANYPYPAGPGTCEPVNVLGYPECSMDRLPIGVSLLRNGIVRPDQPLWVIVQAFKGIPLKEMRWEAYSALVNGANGIFWAGWTWVHPLGDGADIWPETRQVVSEVASLHPALSRYRTNRHDVASLDPDVEVLELSDPTATSVVLAASRNGLTGFASISMGSLQAEWAEVLFENRWLPIVDGKVTDYFNGYEAHVYRVDEGSNSTPPTAIPTPDQGEAARFRIRVAPNPASGVARARYELASPGPVSFAVYDLAGRRLVGAAAYAETPTRGSVVWDGHDAAGRVAPPGIYFVRGTAAGGGTATARIVWR
jgi:hypothetical protein